MMKKIAISVLFLVFGLIFSGCLGKELPTIQHYELSLDSNFSKTTNSATKNVRNPQEILYLGTDASLKITSKKIAYKTNANTIEYFVKNEWIEPLPLMVDSLMLKATKQMGFSLASEKKNGIPTLSLNLLDFYYDQKHEIVMLNLLVKQNHTSFLLNQEVKVQSGGFHAIILAMNQAINAALLESLTLLKNSK
ncbi:MAG: hypothetical protein NC548_60620 [Lachnospiraceae bacterium]|nr:hypothetical protein [Lachnospiraceae bacterium]